MSKAFSPTLRPPAPPRGLAPAPLGFGDLEEIQIVEQACFACPWDWGCFLPYFVSSRALALAARSCRTQALAGYLCAWLSDGELDVHNLAVSPSFRRRGLGRWLMNQALWSAARSGACNAVLLVRPGNLAARQLYQSLGFRLAGVIPGYYREEDALRLGITLSPSA